MVSHTKENNFKNFNNFYDDKTRCKKKTGFLKIKKAKWRRGRKLGPFLPPPPPHPLRQMPISQLYKESGILRIRYNAEIEEKATGQKKIGGTRPAFSKIEKQITYKKNDGSY